MLREIAVKTLTGRGRINYFYERELKLDPDISKTLGCWIINLQYAVECQGEEIYIDGSYSIQLWYAKNQDQASSVYEEKISFREKATMVYRNLPTLSDEKNVKVYVNQYPNAVYMHLNEDQSVSLKIEALYFIDVFQEAVLVVETKDSAKADFTLDEEILLNVNPNYLVDKEKR